MRIVDITEIKCEQLTIEGYSDWTEYRRYSADSWEVLMGESWETLYLQEELEELYQEYMDAHIKHGV